MGPYELPTIAAGTEVEPQADTIELVKRSAAGDTRAFEELYRGHVGRVRALCLRLAQNGEEADQLTQDVFVRAWQKLSSFRGDAAFGTWLHRLTVNLVRDHQRSEGRRRSRQRPIDSSDFRLAQPAVRTEDAIELEKAIASLPPRARRAIVLHEIHGYRCREIAEMTGTATGTIQAHLHRARKLLRKMLTR